MADAFAGSSMLARIHKGWNRYLEKRGEGRRSRKLWRQKSLVRRQKSLVRKQKLSSGELNRYVLKKSEQREKESGE
jgi:hypothetical protein